MKPIPLNPEIAAVARRVIWFEAPAEALENLIRCMAYVLGELVVLGTSRTLKWR